MQRKLCKMSYSKLLKICQACDNKEEAEQILEEYTECLHRNYEIENPVEIAKSNLGYLFGYLSLKERQKLYALFLVSHPIFGYGFGRGVEPTPEEAFNLGVKKGKEIRGE